MESRRAWKSRPVAFKNLIMLCYGIVIGCSICLLVMQHRTVQSICSLSSELDSKAYLPQLLPEVTGNKKMELNRNIQQYITAAVLSTENSDMEVVAAAYRTWGKSMVDFTVFVGPNIIDYNIFTATKMQKFHLYTVGDIYHILQHFHGHNNHPYNWLFISLSATYVNVDAMNDLIMKLDPQQPYYLGHSSSQRPYCNKDSGIILSKGLLEAVIPRLSECTAESIGANSWDENLGECIKQIVGVTCYNKTSSKYFVINYDSGSPDQLWNQGSTFSSAVSIYPVTRMEHMYLLHYYLMSELLKSHYGVTKDLHYTISEVCSQLPDGMLQHEAVQAHCLTTADNHDTNLHFRHEKANHRYDIQTWKYFDPQTIYTVNTLQPSTSRSRYDNAEIESVVRECIKIISNKYKTNTKFELFQNGYIRDLPGVGKEYMIDATYIHAEKKFTERIHLLRQLQMQYDVIPSKSENSEEINLIVPISDANDRCFKFISMYETIVLKKHNNVRLILVVYGSASRTLIDDKVHKLLQKYHHGRITVVNGEGEFSHVKGLNQGMQSLDADALAFMCDVHMTIDSSFFTRCRSNTINGSSVYSPAILKMYSPKFTSNGDTKYWDSYRFGMLCIYKSDYDAIGLDVALMGWGSEDNAVLFEKIIKSKLEIIRAPDPSLIHHWQPQQCINSTMSPKHYRDCLNSRTRDLGSKDSLATFIYNNHPELNI